MPRHARPDVKPTESTRAKPALMLIAAAGIAALFWPAAAGADMRRAEFQSEMQRIDSEFDAAKARCESYGGNAHDICLAEARGNLQVAKAELEERKAPSTRTRYKVLVARAEANFDVAAEECDEGASASKDACVEEAWKALARDKADARKRRITR